MKKENGKFKINNLKEQIKILFVKMNELIKKIKKRGNNEK